MCSSAQNLLLVPDIISPRAEEDCAETVFYHWGDHASLLQASSKICPSPSVPTYINSVSLFFISKQEHPSSAGSPHVDSQ